MVEILKLKFDYDFDDEGRVGNSLAEILTLNIVQNIEAKVWSIFLS